MSRGQKASKYAPFGDALLRAPLRPIERYSQLVGASTPDPGEHLAIAVASESIAAALSRPARDAKSARQLQSAVLRYLIRMSSRPTPFGMFAGVGLVKLGARTNLYLSSATPRTRTRCDTLGVYSLVWALESLPEIMNDLSVTTHSAAFVFSDRVRLSGIDRAPSPVVDKPVELRLTTALSLVIRLAHRPIRYSDLAQELEASIAGATAQRIEEFLRSLWQFGYLITDLRPPLTGGDPFEFVLHRLAAIPAAKTICTELARFHAALSEWDRNPEKDAANYQRLTSDAKRLTGGTSKALLQVDSALMLSGAELNVTVAEDAARAAEILLRITPYPSGPTYLAAYRQAFVTRYGHERPVPLLELLDPETGIGPLVANPGERRSNSRREQMLLELATRALYERLPVIELSEEMLASLETYLYSPNSAPVSVDVYAQIATASAADLDQGRYLLVIGPNLGAMGAGKNLGRFFDVLPTSESCLEQMARAEESLTRGKVVAALVYRPASLRVANIVICPAVRRYEVGVAVTARKTTVEAIPLSDLYVCIDRDRLMLRWISSGVDQGEVIVTSGHMLNPMSAPALCRFLEDISRDGRPLLSRFDWGPARQFPYLPRVAAGRIVLRLAQWRMEASQTRRSSSSSSSFRSEFTSWREKWQVPRHVYVNRERGTPDNRLLLDLDSDAHVDLIYEMLREAKAGDALTVQEGLPGPDDAWVLGASGRYMSEIVVSCVRKDVSVDEKSQWRVGTGFEPVPRELRLFPPGTEWLTIQLYGSPHREDALISETVGSFAARMQSHGVEDWMFLRYVDPDPHLRVRFRGAPQHMSHKVLPAVSSWATQLVREGTIARFSFETYDREVERYGGIEGMEVTERIYCADSQAVVELIRLARACATQLDIIELAALAIDDCLAAFGLSVVDRLAWCESLGIPRRSVSAEYRTRQARLHTLLTEGSRQVPASLVGTLHQRRRTLEEARVALDELRVQGRLSKPVHTLLQSYVHLHCNRFLGRDLASERRVKGLLLRTYYSILRRSAVAAAREDSPHG